ncbi:MAG: FAS1-like dehydratase domain-containing protein [Acidimicrobiales bacterium]
MPPNYRDWGPPTRVRIEHGPVWAFARAIKDDNAVYASEEAARGAGFGAVPCPPTYTFVMNHCGAFPDLQPPGSDSAPTMDPDAFTARPGLYLHGEQEFIYHRLPVVGDVLEGRTRVSEPFAKEGGRRPMEMTLYETEWRDAADGAPVVSSRITSIFIPS